MTVKLGGFDIDHIIWVANIDDDAVLGLMPTGVGWSLLEGQEIQNPHAIIITWTVHLPRQNYRQCDCPSPHRSFTQLQSGKSAWRYFANLGSNTEQREYYQRSWRCSHKHPCWYPKFRGPGENVSTEPRKLWKGRRHHSRACWRLFSNIFTTRRSGSYKDILNVMPQQFLLAGYEGIFSAVGREVSTVPAKSPVKDKRAEMVHYQGGGPMERIAVDIMGPLPVSRRGNRFVMVYFTR